MQKRLLVSGGMLIVILGVGYGIMQFTSNEEASRAVTKLGVHTSTNTEPEKVATATVDQASTTTPAAALTATEVARHTTENDCWVIVNNGIYDVTQYVPQHPGGKGKIVPLCGTDATSAFEGQHAGDRKPETMLAKLKIGDLQK